jgi:hypothetical protein
MFIEYNDAINKKECIDYILNWNDAKETYKKNRIGYMPCLINGSDIIYDYSERY